MMVAVSTGGISSFAAVWLVLVPLEAALSASRRVAAFASALALVCVGVLIALTTLHALPEVETSVAARSLFTAFGVASATLYAAGLAFGAESLQRTSGSLLSDEESRYRLLACNMSDVISRHRRNGAVQFISPAAEALLATPASGLLGHGLFDRVHVADRPAYLTALSDAARGGEACSVEFRLRRDASRGSERGRSSPAEFIWVEMRCRPLERGPESSRENLRENLQENVQENLRENTGHAALQEAEVVAVMRDVTDRKIQEQALDLARTTAERADASKTRFLATMSHELRTPLNAIIGFSDMMAQEDVLLIDAVRRKEYARLINDSGQHLLSVVNGILDMSKMEAGSFEISPEPFAPRPALVNCCNLLALKARENGIDLVTRAPDNLPYVTGDPRAFKQIVLNLVSNAIKFTERGGSVTVSAAIEGSRLELRVADNGVGIGPEDLKRIGDPFFQAGKTYQRRHEGTGLGLSIVKSLVSLHGGEMTVQSKIDEGTTIIIALPVKFSPPVVDQPSSNIATLAQAMRIQHQTHQGKKSA